LTTISTLSYCTVEFPFVIKELIELFLGKEKSCIRRNFHGALLGTRLKGEQTKSGNGGCE
jgi:hypothetical protein